MQIYIAKIYISNQILQSFQPISICCGVPDLLTVLLLQPFQLISNIDYQNFNSTMPNPLNRVRTFMVWIRTVVPLQKRNVFVVYFFILLAAALDNMNTSAALTLSKDIEKTFNTNSSTASWALSGYALTLGSFILITGKLADIIGPHNIFLIGLCIIWICSLICACIPHTSIVALIVFRALQGVGASALVPSTVALAANYFTDDLSKYLAPALGGFIIALTGVFGVGVTIGGAFSQTSTGYRGFFWFAFGYGLILNIILLFLIIPVESRNGDKNMKLKNIDFVGGFLVIAGVLLVILGLTEGGENWRSPKAYIPLVVGFFTFLSSLAFEIIYLKRFQRKNRNKSNPSDWRLQVELLFPPEIIKIPNFLPILIQCGFYYATFTMVLIGIDYYTFIEENSPIIVAIKVLPLPVGLVFGALVYRTSYYNKVGLKNMLTLSSAISLGMCIWFSRIDYKSDHSYWKFGFVSLFLYGYGINMFFNIYFSVVVSNTPLHLQGVVNGIYQTCGQVLLSIGNALVPSILGNLEVATTEQAKQTLFNKFQKIFYVVLAFHAVMFLIMIFLVKNHKKENGSDEGNDEEDLLEEKKQEDECECHATVGSNKAGSRNSVTNSSYFDAGSV